MDGGVPHLLVKLDTRDPIEIGDFVSAFTSVSHQYERWVKETRPELSVDARVYVKEVRHGCIEAELVPLIAAGLAYTMTVVDRIAIVEGFAKFYTDRISAYFQPGGRVPDASKADLRDFNGGLAAIANDVDGAASISTVHYEDDVKQVKPALYFGTVQARTAIDELYAHRLEIDRKTDADHSKVLMWFVQSNTKNAVSGKRSGEQVVISTIHPRPLPIIYASDIAERRIKYEVINADDNVFKKGFVVDVNVQYRHGDRPIAYRITHLHDVIDLPDDEEE